MTFEEFKSAYRTFAPVKWNGTVYRATGIQSVKAHGKNERINSVQITEMNDRGELGLVQYWLDPSELRRIKEGA